MKKNFGPQSWLFPEPVLIIGTFDANGKPNAMNAAWGGISDFNQISIALSEHKTTDNLKVSKAFTVAFATVDTMIPCDYVGIVSQNKVPDKMDKTGWTFTKSEFVNAPVFNELKVALECEVVSFSEETGILTGNVLNVCADEEVLTNGKIDLAKLNPITYDAVNSNYIKLGDIVGKAFQEGKKLK